MFSINQRMCLHEIINQSYASILPLFLHTAILKLSCHGKSHNSRLLPLKKYTFIRIDDFLTSPASVNIWCISTSLKLWNEPFQKGIQYGAPLTPIPRPIGTSFKPSFTLQVTIKSFFMYNRGIWVRIKLRFHIARRINSIFRLKRQPTDSMQFVCKTLSLNLVLKGA